MVKFITIIIAIIAAAVFFKVENISTTWHVVSGVVTTLGMLIGFGIQVTIPKEYEYEDS